jgi:hypothetical protein
MKVQRISVRVLRMFSAYQMDRYMVRSPYCPALIRFTNSILEACVQNPDDAEPTWIKGTCFLYRSPVVHPGDGESLLNAGSSTTDNRA